jgi:hypothetical protein
MSIGGDPLEASTIRQMLPKITDERTAQLRSDSTSHWAPDRLRIVELEGQFQNPLNWTVKGIQRPA